MTSEAEALELPIESIKTLEKKLAKQQIILSRKKKGLNNFKKQSRKIAITHEKIVNVRKDKLNKISTAIAKSHSVVVLENLKIKNMTASAAGTISEPGKYIAQKSGLNRSILRQGWFEFERQLSYKLEWNGGELIKVAPHFTSLTCPKCDHVAKENRKNESFKCVKCGHEGHADVVGAKNILARGHRVLVCGEVGPAVAKKATAKKTSVKQKPLVA